MITDLQQRVAGDAVAGDVAPEVGYVYDSEYKARDLMLRLFRDDKKLRPQDGEVCADVSPVVPWLDAARASEVAVLTNETPIRPPYPNMLLGAVSRQGERWIVRFFMVSVSANCDGRAVSVIDVASNSKGAFLLDEHGRWTSTVTADFLSPRLDGSDHQLVAVALAMFHVKNVGLQEIPFPRHMRRRAVRDTGVEGPRCYHTLTLRPFGEAGERIRRTLSSGEKSLHLVRGHFASYSDARPLFGKYVGTFWKPEHTAGNRSVGIVEKSYTVQPGGE